MRFFQISQQPLKSASGYVSKILIWKLSSLAKGLLAWLFRLGTEPRRVHWCLLVWTRSFRFHDIKISATKTILKKEHQNSSRVFFSEMEIDIVQYHFIDTKAFSKPLLEKNRTTIVVTFLQKFNITRAYFENGASTCAPTV